MTNNEQFRHASMPEFYVRITTSFGRYVNVCLWLTMRLRLI